MAGVNKVILIGNLGSDPEVRFTPGGQAVSNFSIATNETWVDKQGQKQERTEWHRIVVWGKTAELCGEYLKKGRQCYVDGRLQTRKWTDKEGKEHTTTEVVANQVVFLGGGPGRDAGSGAAAAHTRSGPDDYGTPPAHLDEAGSAPNGPPTGSDADIPF